MYDGTLWMLATRAVKAVKNGTGLGNKVRSVTREVGHMSTHVRGRFADMSVAGRILTVVILLGVGAGITAGAFFLAGHSGEGSMRSHIRAEMAANDFVGARRDLEHLRVRVGTLSRTDREELAAPIHANLAAAAQHLRDEIDTMRKAKRFDEALAQVGKLDALDVDEPGALFLRAEVLRGAGRDKDAADAYAHYFQLYPDTSRTDDALFWQALYLRGRGDVAGARSLLETLLQKFPKSDFMVSAKRTLADMHKHGK